MSAVSIALASVLLLTLQIVLMQALGYAQGHHLAYAVISIALLGFGAGGAVLTLWRKQKPGALAGIYVPGMLLCALSTALLPFPASPLLAGLEVDLLHTDRAQWFLLAGLGAVMFLPFFFGAMAISAAFTVRAESIGVLYAANLAGSAIGAAAALAMLRIALPEQIISMLAFVALAAALPADKHRRLLAFITLIVVLAALFAPTLPRSPYKPLSQALLLPHIERTGPLPHPLGRVDVVSSPALRYAPDLSLQYTGPVPAPPHVYIDGETSAQLIPQADPAALIIGQTPRGMPFAVSKPQTVLLLQPGGTPYINLALSYDATITAVEPHPHIFKMLSEIIHTPEVTVLRSDARLFLSRSTLPPQQLIVFPERGMFGGPTGLQTLGEDNLLTVEAVRKAIALLAPQGKLAFTVWLDAPLRHAPRIVDIAAAALREEGVSNVTKHVAAVRGWGSMSLLVSPAPLPENDIAAIAHFADQKGFDMLWPPNDTERFHGYADDELDSILAELLGNNPERFLTEYRFDVRATVDDRPFFNQFLRLNDRGADLDLLSVSERGLVYVKALLLILGIAVVLLVFAPLLPLRTSAKGAPFVLLFFSGIGTGFMLFEIALIQRMSLLWGHPVISAAAVITALLCGMGAGSLISRRASPTPRRLAAITAGIAGMHLLLPFVFSFAVESLLPAAAITRYAVGMLLPAICAIPMGMPFPLAVRLLAESRRRQIPWACGIDGATAVITAPAAALIAFQSGFTSLSYLAAATYLIAAIGALTAAHQSGKNSN